tara:strand:- start:1734 stop:2078 length:345 start_codon:yes stop_codon:yes gene_type:complete
MKKLFYFNVLIYITIIGLYIYATILGAIGQIGLGAFQIIIAILISTDIKKTNNLGYKALQIYWYFVLAYSIAFILFITSDSLNNFSSSILYIIPMTIGFYFVIVTFLIYKYSNL